MKPYNSPEGWFSFKVPNHWRIADHEGIVVAHDPEGSKGVLEVSCRKMATEEVLPDPATLLLEWMRKLHVRPRKRDVLVGEIHEAPFATAFGYVRKYLFVRQVYIKAWIIVRGSLMCMVNYRCAPEHVAAEEEVIRHVMESFSLSGDPAESIDEFMQQAMVFLTKGYPQLKPVSIDGLTIKLESGLEMNLDNLYRQCTADRDHKQRHLEAFLETLVSLPQEELFPAEFQQVSSRIMPVIKTAEAFSTFDVAFSDFANETRIMYVVDYEKSVAFLNKETIKNWSVDLIELKRTAIENLARYKDELKMLFLESEEGKAIVIAEGDGYDASRILLPDFYEKISSQLGREFLVGIPNRDFLVAFTKNSPRYVRNTIRQIKEDFQRMDYPVTDRIFYFTEFGILEYNEQGG